MVKGGYSASRTLQPGEGAFLSDILAASDVSGLTGLDFGRLMSTDEIEQEGQSSDLRYRHGRNTSWPSSLRSLLSVFQQQESRKSFFDVYAGYQNRFAVTGSTVFSFLTILIRQ